MAKAIEKLREDTVPKKLRKQMDLIDEKLKVITAQSNQNLRKKLDPLSKKIDSVQEDMTKLNKLYLRSRLTAIEDELAKLSQYEPPTAEGKPLNDEENEEAPAAADAVPVEPESEEDVMEMYVNQKIKETFEPLSQTVESMKAKLNEHGGSVHNFSAELSKIDNHYM